MNIIPILMGIVGIFLAVFFYLRERNNYKRIDRMLDEILEEQKLSESDIKEGSISALASKLVRIQEKLNLEIHQANEEREQVKGLISNMSHQLKTPLANIMMYQEILSESNLTPEKEQAFLKKMRTQTEKIHWILNSLFKMVKLEQNVITFDADFLSILPTIRKAVNEIYGKADKKGIQICIEEFENISLWHNEKWTAEAFSNILENAVKYSREGGTITLSFQQYEIYSAISITDCGIGMKKEEQTKIFHRFYRSPEVENVEGSGIGLYLSKLIIEKEKGYITVDSEYGKGSTFTIYLQKACCKNDRN